MSGSGAQNRASYTAVSAADLRQQIGYHIGWQMSFAAGRHLTNLALHFGPDRAVYAVASFDFFESVE
jgi:hypothetical protein